MLTFFQCRPSSYCRIFLSLFLGSSWVAGKMHSCNLNGTIEVRDMTWSSTNGPINWKVQSSSVGSFLEQIFVYSCLILLTFKQQLLSFSIYRTCSDRNTHSKTLSNTHSLIGQNLYEPHHLMWLISAVVGAT